MPTTYSPLRYPGGKSKLYQVVQPIISSNIGGENSTYVEPFAGGAGLALKLLYRNDVERLVLNDIDTKLFYFWNSCLHNTENMCRLVFDCQINIDTWDIQKRIYSLPSQYSELEVGFATFFLNRCNVSGVLSGGPIGGRDQDGAYLLDARFNKKDLVKKIQAIGQNSDRIDFYNLDAVPFLLNVIPQLPQESSFLNIDPPYVKKGPNLYENFFDESDHTELSNVIKLLSYKWIVTYDKCDLINNLYAQFRKKIINLHYSAGNAKTGQEYLIFSDRIRLQEDRD